MIHIQPFEDLGRFDNDWLAARYHFSFAGYHDPAREARDGVTIAKETEIKITALEDAEILLADLP